MKSQVGIAPLLKEYVIFVMSLIEQQNDINNDNKKIL